MHFLQHNVHYDLIEKDRNPETSCHPTYADAHTRLEYQSLSTTNLPCSHTHGIFPSCQEIWQIGKASSHRKRIPVNSRTFLYHREHNDILCKLRNPGYLPAHRLLLFVELIKFYLRLQKLYWHQNLLSPFDRR